jgi:hypothetical protein
VSIVVTERGIARDACACVVPLLRPRTWSTSCGEPLKLAEAGSSPLPIARRSWLDLYARKVRKQLLDRSHLVVHSYRESNSGDRVADVLMRLMMLCARYLYRSLFHAPLNSSCG